MMGIPMAPPWLVALAAALLLQSVSSFVVRAVPVLGPAVTGAAGAPPEAVGHLAAAAAIGTLWCLTGVAGLLPRLGALRVLQLGAVAGALGLVLTASGWWWAMLLGAVLVGAGYAPSPPAGSDILSRSAPARHRSLLFSIKQSGVPFGAMVAGLMLPAVALALDWRSALLAGAALALLGALAVQPWRAAIDAGRDPTRPARLSRFVSADVAFGPWRSLAFAPGLAAIAAAGFAFAVVQGCLLAFLVTFLAVERGFGLAAAGLVFAAMQVAGTGARIAAGWLADRLGSNRLTLILLGLVSAAAVASVALIGPDWPLGAVLAVGVLAGLASISWNGVYLAEVARLAPDGRVGEATAGSTFFTFLGYAAGPAAFAFLVATGAGYPLAFVLAGTCPLAAAAVLAFGLRPGSRPTEHPQSAPPGTGPAAPAWRRRA